MNLTHSVKTVRIDEREVGAAADQTILQVAEEMGIPIPTLCHLEGLSDVGACRLCLVEGRLDGRLMPSCVTRVWEGMDVVTHSERLDSYRKMIVELLFSERNHICSVCVANGHCELQTLGHDLGLSHVEFPYLYPNLPVDASHERFAIDHNRCVLCTRCVRVCDQIEGAHTWDVMGRGISSIMITDFNGPWGLSDTCTSCGKCVQVCPTGALFDKGRSVAEMIKDRDFLAKLTRMREERP